MNDAEFLRRYAEEGSQEAFAELVRFRIGLVYASALRRCGGDAHRAEDVTQAVFAELARNAASLCRHTALIGWLYTSTRYTAGNMARSERRRRAREQEAYTMHEDLILPSHEIPAERLRPFLDDAMDRLSETDRRALLLRFFDGCSMTELGKCLGLSEPAAKKRVERALGKLKIHLAKRGLLSTALAVGAALSQESTAATLPVGLAATVSGSILAAVPAATMGSSLIALMSTSKLTAIIGAASILGLLSIGTGVYELRKSLHGQVALEGAKQQYEAGQRQLQELLQSAEAADKASANLQKEADAADRGKDLATTAAAKAAADLARFKATPEMKRLLSDVSGAIMGPRCRLFFREIGLTAAQAEEVEKRAVDLQVPSFNMASDEQLRAIFGDQAAQQFKNYLQQEKNTDNFVRDLAAVTGISGAPLSVDQELQLAQIYDNNSQPDPQGVRETSADWAKIEAQAQTVLMPSQQKAAEAQYILGQFDSALTRAQQGQDTSSAVGPGLN